MEEKLGEQENIKPIQQTLLEQLYLAKVGSRVPDAREFKENVATIIMLALKTNVINYSDVVEILGAMRRCLTAEKLQGSVFLKIVQKESEKMWKLLDEEEEKQRQTNPFDPFRRD